MMGSLGHEDHEKWLVEWVAFDDEQAAEKGELGGLESWIGEDIILFSFFSFFIVFVILVILFVAALFQPRVECYRVFLVHLLGPFFGLVYRVRHSCHFVCCSPLSTFTWLRTTVPYISLRLTLSKKRRKRQRKRRRRLQPRKSIALNTKEYSLVRKCSKVV